ETVSLATAIFSISNGFTGLAVAWSMDRFDPRWIISGGAVILTLSLMGAGHVSTPWQLFFSISFSASAMPQPRLFPARRLSHAGSPAAGRRRLPSPPRGFPSAGL